MSVFPTTAHRVAANTPASIHARIEADTVARVRHLANDRAMIPLRLADLDDEWDVDRTLETADAALILGGVGLAVATGNRWFFALPAAVAGFMLQHALQGWCPPLPLLRWLGFRTRREIELERHALKAVRGDYGPPTGPSGTDDPADRAWRAVLR